MGLIGDACQILCCHVHVPGTALVDRTVNIDHRQVCYAQAIEQFANGRTCGAAAVHHNLDLCNVLFGKAQGAKDGSAGNDGGSVLVIMENRDGAAFDEFIFNPVAFW